MKPVQYWSRFLFVCVLFYFDSKLELKCTTYISSSFLNMKLVHKKVCIKIVFLGTNLLKGKSTNITDTGDLIFEHCILHKYLCSRLSKLLSH